MTLLCSSPLFSQQSPVFNLGLSYTYHIDSDNDDYNNWHPSSGVEIGNVGAVFFYNSFMKQSFGVYYKYQRGGFMCRVGVLTGYNYEQRLNNNYVVAFPREMFVSHRGSKAMMMVAPGYRINLNNNLYSDIELIGNAVSISLNIRY